MRLLFLLTIIFIVPITTQLQAKDFTYYNEVAELNRIDPLQNPRVKNGTDIVGSKIQDRQNKVIGAVQDIIIDKEGSIEMLGMNFEPLHLKQQIYLNFKTNKLTSYKGGYGLSFDQDRLEEIYPQLLSTIETASGEDSGLYSVNFLKGSLIRDEKGTRLGEVIDILFNKEKTQARSYLIEIKRQGLKGNKVAIPYQSVEVIPTTNAHPDMVISKEQSKAIVDYVEEM